MVTVSKNLLLFLTLMIVAFSSMMVRLGESPASAQAGTELFRGFMAHISDQIVRDKQDFLEAESCTSWFYEQFQQTPPSITPDAKNILSPLSSSVSTPRDCSHQYPEGMEGLEAARKAYGESQQSLSLSLTFYQFALVGDRDDDEQYNRGELRDFLESVGMAYEAQLPEEQYLSILNEMFDSVRGRKNFQALMDGMKVLFHKGYRFTEADQAILNQQLE